MLKLIIWCKLILDFPGIYISSFGWSAMAGILAVGYS